MKIAAALIAAGLVCLAYRACAAEQDRPHVIWILVKPQPNEPPDQQRIYAISGEYATKADCLRVLSGVRIRAPRATVQCLPKED